MRLTIIGAPNSGKGTQGKLLAQKLGLFYLSTGSFFREHFQSNTLFYDYTKYQFNNGLLCSDDTMNRFMKSLFDKEKIPGNNYLIDSYPRTLPQAKFFDDFVQGNFNVLFLKISKEVSIERALARYSQEQRHDDLVAERRWEVFRSQTLSLVGFYRKEGLLIEQDGVGDIAAINKKLEEKIRSHYGL